MRVYTSRIMVSLYCLLAVSHFSCKKFLSSYSQKNSYIETAGDLEEVLVGAAYHDHSLYHSNITVCGTDDDAQIAGPKTTQSNPEMATGFHYWQANPWINSLGTLLNSDQGYNYLYNRIAGINTVLLNIPLLSNKNEPTAILTRISGEAHFLRAFYYFMLVNIYGKPYRISTAATDFGVPLKTDPATKDQFATRSTTGQVYAQILADLKAAEQELAGVTTHSTIRANQAAVHALLSRVYLHTEENELAVLYANKVIDSHRYELTDLNKLSAGEEFLNRNVPEVVFTMGSNSVIGSMMAQPMYPFYRVSDELAMSYSSDDLRRQAFFIQDSQGYLCYAKKRKTFTPGVEDASDTYLLRLSEMYLNKAEALAALGRSEEARNSLQELRKKRFDPASLTPVSLEGAALVNRIREERRLELCFESHRWFDLRRYAVNSKYPFSKSIIHRSLIYTGTGYAENGYYELGPYEQDAAAYIIPIANEEVEFNKGQIVNEPRPDRPLKQ